jgi:hypothetical protein
MPLRLRKEVQEVSRGVSFDRIGVPHPCRVFCTEPARSEVEGIAILTFLGTETDVKIPVPQKNEGTRVSTIIS